MALVYQEVGLPEVLRELSRRGYGLNQNRAYAVQLTIKSKERKRRDGRPEIILLIGISAEDLMNIRRRHDNPISAADEIEAISLGHQQSANQPATAAPAPVTVDPGFIAKIAENRASSEIAELRSVVTREIEDMRRLREEMTGILQVLRGDFAPKPPEPVEPAPAPKAVVPKKRGRPKGSKNKKKEAAEPAAEPKKTQAEEAADALDFGPPPAKGNWFDDAP